MVVVFSAGMLFDREKKVKSTPDLNVVTGVCQPGRASSGLVFRSDDGSRVLVNGFVVLLQENMLTLHRNEAEQLTSQVTCAELFVHHQGDEVKKIKFSKASELIKPGVQFFGECEDNECRKIARECAAII